jgi:peptide/nickel transport system substrate-binding protein
MRSRRFKLSKLSTLVVAVALVAAACAGGGGGGGGGGEPVSGGTLTVGAQQFPINSFCGNALNNIAWCYYMFNETTTLSAYEQTPDLGYKPELVTGADVDEGPPFSVTFHIKPEAEWNDGTPVSSKDFVFTWKISIDPKQKFVDTADYEKIKSADIIDDKTVKFTFHDPYPAWQGLFGTGTNGGVYPEHILKGENLNDVWTKCICDPDTGKPVSDGPYLVTSFKKNSQVTWERNPNWWGPHEPYMDGVVYKYVPDTSTEIEQMRGGEVEAIYPNYQLELKSLVDAPGLDYKVGAGTFWQHLDFQFNAKPLDETWLRQAIFYGIDRQAIVDKLVKPGFPDATPLQSLVYVSLQSDYEPHFDIYNYDPEKAESLLTDNGCKKGSDGIYVCDGQKLSFTYKSTAGDALRELQFQIIQAQLKKIGIDFQNAFAPSGPVFTDLTKKDYEIFQFGWVGTPDPSGAVEIYKCQGEQNYQDYCNKEATKLLDETNTEIDPTKRADLFNQADQILAKDAVSIPLWEAPQPLVVQDYVHGTILNATQDGLLFNAEDVWIEKSQQ